MLCKECQVLGHMPPSFWGQVWSTEPRVPAHFAVSHHETLTGLRENACRGCHLCNLVLEALDRQAKLSHKCLDRHADDPVSLHVWRDLSHNPVTGDDVDERRVDPICTAAHLGKLHEILNQTRHEDGEEEAIPFVTGQLRCSLSPVGEPTENTGSSAANTTTGSEEAMNLVRSWWNICLLKHETCRKTFVSLPPLPTRVIDVGESGATSSKVIATDHRNGTYVALSHCWGKAPPLTSTTKTIARRMAGIADRELPPTFRDAVKLCRRLGIRYLWIDSLCIIQNSAEDWRAEAAVMGRVYSRAACTLAALSATDSQGGLFQPRNGSASVACHAILFGKACIIEHRPNPFEEIFGDVRMGNNSMLEAMPLHRRAWVLQEQILAGRTIEFKNNSVLWNCSELRASESNYLGLRGIPQKQMDIYAGLRSVLTQAELREGMPKVQIYGYWYRVVMNYKSRNMTRATDTFPAISGLAKTFASVFGDQYLAGLWRNDLHVGLLWRRDHLWRRVWEGPVASSNSIEVRDSRAPSWSWAAADGDVWYDHRIPSLDLAQQISLAPGIAVLDARVDPIHDDYPLGEVFHAELRVRGMLIFAELRAGEQPDVKALGMGNLTVTYRLVIQNGNETARSEDSPAFSRCFFDNRIPAPGRYACCPIVRMLSRIEGKEDIDEHWALILESVPEQNGCYRRVAICEMQPNEAATLSDAQASEFTLG